MFMPREFYQYNERASLGGVPHVPELDLTLASLYRVGGKTPGAMPGLAALAPPRRAARGRERERLVVYLALGGNAPLSSADYDTLANQIGEKFFHTPGSLTLAMKTAAEAANATLLDRNMRTTGHGQYAMAVLALAALRADELYLVQSGPVHAFWLRAAPAGSRHYFEPQLAGRGLGFSQTPRLYFAHMELGAGDRLLLAAQMPPEWEQLLLAERGAAMFEATRRRLLASNAPDLHAALILAQSGSGKLTIVPEEPGSTASSLAAVPVAPAAIQEPAHPPPEEPVSTELGEDQAGPGPEAQPPHAEPSPAAGRLAAFTAADVPVAMPEPPPGSVPPAILTETKQEPPVSTPVDSAPRPGGTVADRPVPVMARQPVSSSAKKRRGRGIFLALATAMRATRLFFLALGGRLRAFLPRLLPGMEDDQMGNPGSRVSRGTLLFIAIAVPVVIASVAAAVYFQRGRAAQFATYYNRAGEEAGQAVAASDPTSQRQHWLATLQLLDQAEAYAKSPDSQSLRTQAQNSLDALDRITRLDYRRAFAAKLGGTITQMAATDNDVYLLEGGTGKVLHAARSELGYNLDSGFQCAPGNVGGVDVGPLVDLVTLPAGNSVGADILAVDAGGNGLYCGPDQAPQSFQLAPPPQPIQQIAAIAAAGDTLYVLDAAGNFLWQYDGSQGVFDTTPLAFFGSEVPPLQTATDMAVLDNNLFLLHSDGHISSCALSLIPDVSPTRCTDPANLVDTRSGSPGGPALNGAIFAQMQSTPPPNAFVALLDGVAQAIYRFSPSQLDLQDQLRALPGSAPPVPQGVPASAFTIAPNHIIFLAVGDSLYYAEEPSP
jgi:hypothetical protein